MAVRQGVGLLWKCWWGERNGVSQCGQTASRGSGCIQTFPCLVLHPPCQAQQTREPQQQPRCLSPTRGRQDTTGCFNNEPYSLPLTAYKWEQIMYLSRQLERLTGAVECSLFSLQRATSGSQDATWLSMVPTTCYLTAPRAQQLHN